MNSKRPPIPAIPPPPTRLGDEGDIAKAAEKERRRLAMAQGRESTILGGSTLGTAPYQSTLLGG